jgi:hypothetical protein
MIKIESANQVAKLLGEKFGKTKSIVLDDSQTDLQERHTLSTEKGIVKGSYMSDQQTLDLHNEVILGEESLRATDEFNRDMGIAD